MKMRIRLARKIIANPARYSLGKRNIAAKRLGLLFRWVMVEWTCEIPEVVMAEHVRQEEAIWFSSHGMELWLVRHKATQDA